MSSWRYIQFFTRNPKLQSELPNSFTQRRKLRKTNLRESRFLIARFLIIRLHRNYRIQTWELDPSGEILCRIRISGQKQPIPASRGQHLRKLHFFIKVLSFVFIIKIWQHLEKFFYDKFLIPIIAFLYLINCILKII